MNSYRCLSWGRFFHLLAVTCSALAVLAMAGAPADAGVIYQDTFTAADGTPLLGRAPETNNGVAGATYGAHNASWEKDIQGNQARLGADTGVSLDLNSTGAYVKPTWIQVSASMFVNNINGSTTPSNTGNQRGVGLGFYTGTGGDASENNWRGLLLGTDGRLILAQDDVAGSNRAGFLAEIATGLSTAVPHTVSYRINTVSGDVSKIMLDGVEQADVETTVFSSETNRVGFLASANSGGRTGFYDDFTVTALGPDPLPIADLFNTGVDDSGVALPGGTPAAKVNDLHYQVIEVAGTSVTPFDAFLAEDDNFPIPPWLANDADSRWIDPNGDANSSAPGGNYVYRTTFTLPGHVDLNAVLITGGWASDDGGSATDILINGISTGQTNGGFGGLTPFSITSGFLTGTNTLDFVLANGSAGPSGLRVDNLVGVYRLAIPEPSALLLATLGLLGLLVAGRRRKGR